MFMEIIDLLFDIYGNNKFNCLIIRILTELGENYNYLIKLFL